MDELQAGVLRPIEERLGRVRTDDPNAPRTIDLDILVYDGITIEEGLWEQAHVCIPLSELLPDYTHPLRGETLSAIARRFSQTTPLRIREDLRLPDRK
jgi:7,8-dihydro-6-hydroxymethylpterin-pyrophosphokinase